MITDQELTFTTGASFTAGGKIGNAYDAKVARPIGAGKAAPQVDITITVAGAGGTSAVFDFVGADDEALTSNVVVAATTGPVLLAAMTAGARLLGVTRLSTGVSKRFWGIKATNTGVFTAGSIAARLVLDKQEA